jgi:hypothetical protein
MQRCQGPEKTASVIGGGGRQEAACRLAVTAALQAFNFRALPASFGNPMKLAGFTYSSAKGPNSQRAQIGLLSADGKLQPITRDTNRYATLTLSADGKSASSVQIKTTRALVLLRAEDLRKTGAIPAPLPQAADPQLVQWTPDGKLLVSDGEKITRMDANGQNATVLISDPGAGIQSLSPCGDRYLLLTWRYPSRQHHRCLAYKCRRLHTQTAYIAIL